MSLSPNTVIIIADIEKKDYIFLIFYDSWAEYFVVLFCPACGAQDRFKRHARYTKYYYSKELWILRLKCEVCGTTHAVIPSFSLPGTSIGAKEAEEYLIKRAEGVGRGVAGKVLLQAGWAIGEVSATDRQNVPDKCQSGQSSVPSRRGSYLKRYAVGEVDSF
jgi:hypothetical protein